MKRSYQIEELTKHYKRETIKRVIEAHGHTQGLARFPWDMFIDHQEWSICCQECNELEN